MNMIESRIREQRTPFAEQMKTIQYKRIRTNKSINRANTGMNKVSHKKMASSLKECGM